jgi:predicted HicB family RNase H-like nuclease
MIKEKGGFSMPATEAHIRATSKWEKENYDKYQVRLKKGELDKVKAFAASKGESVNGFINRAINEAMGKDTEVVSEE